MGQFAWIHLYANIMSPIVQIELLLTALISILFGVIGCEFVKLLQLVWIFFLIDLSLKEKRREKLKSAKKANLE